MARDHDRNADKNDRELMEEAVTRARRIETRVTLIANHLGVDAGEQTKPSYDATGNRLLIASRKTSLDDILTATPHGSRGVTIMCRGVPLGTLNT